MSKRTSSFLSLVAAIGLLWGCQTEPAEETGAMDETAAPADLETVRGEIAAHNDRWEAAATAGDPTALAALYAEDAVLLAPGMPRAEGRAAIEDAFRTMLAGGTFDTMTIEIDAIDRPESGEHVIVTGPFQGTGTMADGTPFQDQGKYLGVLENVNGEWYLIYDIWNSDAAMAGDVAAPTAADPAETAEPAGE